MPDFHSEASAHLRFLLSGHLFTDPDMPEYNPDASEHLWQRVGRFLSHRVSVPSFNM